MLLSITSCVRRCLKDDSRRNFLLERSDSPGSASSVSLFAEAAEVTRVREFRGERRASDPNPLLSQIPSIRLRS